MSSFSSRLKTVISQLQKSNAHIQVKVERHQRRMAALQQTMEAQANMMTKLRAWEPWLESAEKLEFLLETVTRGNQATANQSKNLILAAVESFKNGESSGEQLLESLEGNYYYIPIDFVQTN